VILAEAASAAPGQTPPAGLSFVREWRAGWNKTANTYVIEVAL